MSNRTAAAVHWVEQGRVPDRGRPRSASAAAARRAWPSCTTATPPPPPRSTEAFVAAMRDGADRAAAREGERAALRAARRVLRRRARAAPQVQQLLVARRRRRRSTTPRPRRCRRPASAPGSPTASASSSSAAAGARSRCGWPRAIRRSRITALSNSHSQRAFIEAEAARRGLANVEVAHARHRTTSTPRERFDRVVSVEMFEHLRNWPRAFAQRRALAGARRPLLHARVRAPRRALSRSSSATPATG